MVDAQRTTFTGTSTFGESIHAGERTFLPDGSCPARGVIEVYHDVKTDPRVTGQETIVRFTYYNEINAAHRTAAVWTSGKTLRGFRTLPGKKSRTV
jgi:hypothetical protein